MLRKCVTYLLISCVLLMQSTAVLAHAHDEWDATEHGYHFHFFAAHHSHGTEPDANGGFDSDATESSSKHVRRGHSNHGHSHGHGHQHGHRHHQHGSHDRGSCFHADHSHGHCHDFDSTLVSADLIEDRHQTHQERSVDCLDISIDSLSEDSCDLLSSSSSEPVKPKRALDAIYLPTVHAVSEVEHLYRGPCDELVLRASNAGVGWLTQSTNLSGHWQRRCCLEYQTQSTAHNVVSPLFRWTCALLI